MQWLPGGKFSTDLESHLNMTDNEITAALCSAARESSASGHESARRIVCREHFKVLYERSPADVQINPESVSAIFNAASQKFGSDCVREDKYTQRGGPYYFPVLQRDGSCASSLDLSRILKDIPVFATGYVFIERDRQQEAEKWLDTNHTAIIKEGRPTEDEQV
jgi:hypothetical protein